MSAKRARSPSRVSEAGAKSSRVSDLGAKFEPCPKIEHEAEAVSLDSAYSASRLTSFDESPLLSVFGAQTFYMELNM